MLSDINVKAPMILTNMVIKPMMEAKVRECFGHRTLIIVYLFVS